ncbi:MAG: M48 family metalloprotease [Desulfobacterales bacterium]|nr:M48 family metalloprotease [Desulfobacterales bacterium]
MKKTFFLIVFVILIINIFFTRLALSLTIAEEEELGKEFIVLVNKYFDIVKDPFIVNYINTTGNKIVSAFPPQPFIFKFYVIKEPSYNAFAGPAAHVFINSGLFESMDNEDELAGILSHEIAHVVCRHISQKISQSNKIQIGTIAAVVASIFLGAGGAGTAAQALSIGSIATGQSIALAYSREDETQADQIGCKYLLKAGYSGKGLVSILKKIKNQEWFGPDQIPTYLTTHPGLSERLTYISSWVDINDVKDTQSSPKVNSYDFDLTHTKISALYNDENIALKKFEKAVAQKPDDAMTNYGYGLVLSRFGERKEAANRIKKALGKNAFDKCILKDLGKVYYLDGKYKEALSILEVSVSPDDYDGLFVIARINMELGNYAEAIPIFERIIAHEKDYHQAIYYLGESYGKINNFEDAHFYLGKYYTEINNIPNALFHLEKSLKLTSDPEKKEKIKELIKQNKKKIKPQIDNR